MPYSDIENDSSRYNPSSDTQIFVNDTPFTEADTPTGLTLTLSGVVAQGDTDITIAAATGEILYEGTRIPFLDGSTIKIVYVSEKTAADATVIPIHPAQVAIADASVATLLCYVPLMSFKTVNSDNQNQEFSDQVCNSKIVVKAVSGIQSTGSTSGPAIHEDPGLALVKEAHYAGKMLKVQIVDPSFRGGKEAKCYCGFSESSGVNTFKQVNITFNPNGIWTELAVNA